MNLAHLQTIHGCCKQNKSYANNPLRCVDFRACIIDIYTCEESDMSVLFKNRDRFIQLGIVISSLRKIRGLSQEQLAERAHTSRTLISAIEAPGIVKGFSLEIFFNIADALEVNPADLLNASVFSDEIMKNKK